MDSALTEYDFVKSFFHAEDTTIFTDIFHDVCKYLQTQTGEWLNSTMDFIGVLLVAMVIQSIITQLQNLEFPILVDFWLPLRDKVTSRFAGIMEKHISSVKTAQSQAKSMNITEAMHYSMKRFAAMTTAVYALGDGHAELLPERAKWEQPLASLVSESVSLLMKFSECIVEDHQTDYIFNNVCFILEEWRKKGVSEKNEVSETFDKYVIFFLDEMMEEHMGFLYEFVKKNEHKKGSQLKLSSNEMKGLKRYKEAYKDDIKEMHEAIKANVKWYGIEVYKAVSVSEESER